MEQLEKNCQGLFLDEDSKDKYKVSDDVAKTNCAERIRLCKAVCCKFQFPLSRQDVEEGIVRWNFGCPYWNLKNRDVYCTHGDSVHLNCYIYDNRPAVCRSYDCSEDKRIGLDFDMIVINPDLAIEDKLKSSFVGVEAK